MPVHGTLGYNKGSLWRFCLTWGFFWVCTTMASLQNSYELFLGFLTRPTRNPKLWWTTWQFPSPLYTNVKDILDTAPRQIPSTFWTNLLPDNPISVLPSMDESRPTDDVTQYLCSLWRLLWSTQILSTYLVPSLLNFRTVSLPWLSSPVVAAPPWCDVVLLSAPDSWCWWFARLAYTWEPGVGDWAYSDGSETACRQSRWELCPAGPPPASSVSVLVDLRG